METKMIDRFSTGERTTHWVMAGSFGLLALTGLGLFDKHFAFLFTLFGGGANAILIHKIVGVVFAFAALSFGLGHLKDVSSFDEDDKAWMRVMGGYLTKTKIKLPPLGKFNPGQKVFGLVALISSVILGVTGVLMWNPGSMPQGLMQLCMPLHSLVSVVMMAFVLLHIYLGTISNPGTLASMTTGKVTEAWARKNSPKWLSRLQEEGKA